MIRYSKHTPTIPVYFYELGAAGTLFANKQRFRNAVPWRPKAFEPLTHRLNNITRTVYMLSGGRGWKQTQRDGLYRMGRNFAG